jgi:hypothetical protein
MVTNRLKQSGLSGPTQPMDLGTYAQGSPEGNHNGAPGQQYFDKLNGVLYVKQFGFEKTGWIEVGNGSMSVDVRAFGATGDGVTDETVAVQSAIDATFEGGEVLFPSGGDYVISSLLVEQASLKIRGSGTIIYSSTATNALFRLPDDSTDQVLDVQGVTIDGNKTGRVAFANCAREVGAEFYIPNGYKRLVLQDVTVKNYLRSSIYAHGSVEVYRCRFLDGATHNGITTPGLAGFAVALQGSPVDTNLCKFDVRDTLFRNSTDMSVSWKNPGGIFLNANELVSGVAPPECQQVIVTGCHFEGMGGVAYGNLYGAIETYNGARKLIVTNNHFYYGPFSAIRASRANDVIIANNYIEHCRHNQAGVISSASIEVAGFNREVTDHPFDVPSRQNEPHERYLVCQNIIKDSQNKAISVQGHDAIIVDNLIEDVAPDLASGVIIGIGALGSNVSIQRNSIKRVGTLAIYVNGLTPIDSGSALYISIKDNVFQADTTVTSGNIFQIATTGSARVSFLQIVGNTILNEIGSVANAISLTRCVSTRIAGNSLKNGAIAFSVDTNSICSLDGNRAENFTTGISAAGTAVIVSRSNDFITVTTKYSFDVGVVLTGEDSGSNFTGDIIPYANLTGNVGTSARRFLAVTAVTLNAGTPISGAKIASNISSDNHILDFRANTAGFYNLVRNKGYSSDIDSTSMLGGSVLSLDNSDATNGNYNAISSLYAGAFVAGIQFVQVSHSTHESSINFVLRNASGTFLNTWRLDGDGMLSGKVAGKGIALQNGPTWTSGSGSPEGAVAAPVGSLFSRTNGGAATSLYVKESGSGNTGWVAK